jgi:hypothetical protein
MSADDRDETIEVRGRDDGSWDVVRRGEPDEVLSNHPLQSMAESERHRLAQERSDEQAGPGDDEADVGTIDSYPDNTGG